MSWVRSLISEDTRVLIRNAAKLVLDLVGDDVSPAADQEPSDAAKIASAVATGASLAGTVVAAARGASKRTRGTLALGLALGAAVGAGVLYLASPAGRQKARELFHEVRGWRRPRSNGAAVEIPPPV
jgi:hypothetical protein